MTASDAPRYLTSTDVRACLPDVRRQLELAERALRALAADAQLPAKIGVHPRPEASWAHAMPAWVPDTTGNAADDLLGIKWVSGFPANAARGVPALHATLVLCDGATGAPRGILDAGGLTAVRTAAVSGVAISHWARWAGDARSRVAMLGAGVQAESHLAMLDVVLPGCSVRLYDRDTARATDLVRRIGSGGSSIVVAVADGPAEALAEADVALTMVSFGSERQTLDAALLEPVPLVVAVDYDMCVPAAIASRRVFLVDEVGQLVTNRASGIFRDYPDPAGMMGTWLDRPRPDDALLVTHLGTGVADLVFGDAVLAEATRRGVGTPLRG